MPDPNIAALLREREHYVRRNLPDRVAAVTAVLASLGYTDPPSEPEPKEPETLEPAPETTMFDAPLETVVPPRPRPRRRENPDG